MGKIKIASVKFNEGDKQTYYYECPLNDVSVGDFVLVDANGQTKVVQVVNLEQFDRCAAPYPADKLKKILSKCDETTIAKKKDPIKAATAALHEKQEAIRKLLKTQKLLYPFNVKIDAKDEKTFSDLLNGNGDNIQNLLGQTPNDVIRFMPQIFNDPHDQNAALLAFSSKDEIGKLEDTAIFLPASLDSIIAFVCDRLPYVTKIIVNPWSDGWVIPIITKIMLTVTVKERWDKVKVVQSISIQCDGIDSCTTVLDTDEREQNWQLGVNTEADYLAWFHAMVTLACSARKEKQPGNSDKSEIGIYYFYGNDNFECVPFAAESLPDSVKEICKRITAAVPDDLYLAFTKYGLI